MILNIELVKNVDSNNHHWSGLSEKSLLSKTCCSWYSISYQMSHTAVPQIL